MTNRLLDIVILTVIYCLLTACTSTVYITTYDQNFKPDKHYKVDIITGWPIANSFEETREFEVIWQ